MKNLSIGTRLLVSFGALLILTLMVGGVAYLGLESQSASLADFARTAYLDELSDKARIEMLQARRAEKDFLLLNASKTVPDVDKKRIEDVLVDYSVGFGKVVKLERRIKDQTNTFRAIAHKIDPLVDLLEAALEKHMDEA